MSLIFILFTRVLCKKVYHRLNKHCKRYYMPCRWSWWSHTCCSNNTINQHEPLFWFAAMGGYCNSVNVSDHSSWRSAFNYGKSKNKWQFFIIVVHDTLVAAYCSSLFLLFNIIKFPSVHVKEERNVSQTRLWLNNTNTSKREWKRWRCSSSYF